MENGFGLLEVLLALTLLALGMLSVVNGLLQAQHHSLESMLMAQADLYANNIYESIQANPSGFQQGAYYQTSTIAPHCNPCTPFFQATKDLSLWQQQIDTQLMKGKGQVHPQLKILMHWPSLLTEINFWTLYGD